MSHMTHIKMLTVVNPHFPDATPLRKTKLAFAVTS